MARYYTIQNSFVGGEISPRLLGRTDTNQYQNSVKEMENCYPFLHGGVTKRYGTKHIAKLASHNSYKPKLVRFVFSRTESYLLVLHNSKMYFFKNGSQITSGGSAVSLTIPYSDSELAELRFAQQENAMIIAHSNHLPKKLTRSSDTSWTLSDLSFDHYAVTDFWWRTASCDLKIISDSDSATTYDVGQYFQWTSSGTSVTSDPALYDSDGTAVAAADAPGTAVVTRVTADTGNGDWTATCVYSDSERQEWQVQAPDSSYPVLQWTSGSYPSTVTFYQQRLYFGGSTNNPQTIWGSKVAEYQNFTLGGLDADAVQFSIASDNFDPVIHLTSASNSVLPFTYNTEYILTGGNVAITPHSVLVSPQTYHGTSDVAPVRIGTDTLFVQRDGKKLRSVYYDINQSQNLADDLTLFAEHITGDGIIDMGFAQEPDYTLWAVRDDGALLSMTYQRDQSVTAWARHTFEGSMVGVAVVPESTVDRVYVCQEREVDGTTGYYIEQIGSEYLDSYTTATSASPTTSWSGLSHLEGMSVTVVADGFLHPAVTVASGAITLNDAASEIVVGVGYESHITLLHNEITSNGQTSQGRELSVDKLILRFQETLGCQVTTSDQVTQILPFHKFGSKYFGTPTAEYTGDLQINALGWSTNNEIRISQPDPFAWTLLAVVARIAVNDM